MVMGAWRISRAGVLTWRSAAIETLGAATVLCTDKTGTLTENRMTIADVRPAAVVLRTGGAVSEAGTDQVISFGRLASQIQPFDPMELAFHLRAKQLAFEAAVQQDLIHQYPFGSGLLAVTNVWRQPDGSLLAAAKGAPEAIAGLCRFSSDNGPGCAGLRADGSSRHARPRSGEGGAQG